MGEMKLAKGKFQVVFAASGKLIENESATEAGKPGYRHLRQYPGFFSGLF